MATPVLQDDTSASFDVYVRLKPLSSIEQSNSEATMRIDQGQFKDSVSISTHSELGEPRTWQCTASFARVFPANSTNSEVYEQIVRPKLLQIMNGVTCNFFAYGHSGSGKTHTIIGYDYNDYPHLGLCLSAARDWFKAIAQSNSNMISMGLGAAIDEERLGVAVRLYEVRGKSAFDLFNNGTECHMRQGADGQTHVRGQTEILDGGKVRVRPIVAKPCWSFDELRQAVLAGLKLRETGSSTVHNESSRTHAFIELEIVSEALLEARNAVIERESELVPVGKRATDVYLEEQMKALIRKDDGQYVHNPDCPLNQARIDAVETEKREYEDRVALAKEAVPECIKTRRHSCIGGKLVFVDLAGSEYYDQANGNGKMGLKQTPQERQQGKQINTDLFALKEVIRSRASGKTRIPFRSSPLTMVLRSHFDGTNDGQSSIILTVSLLEAHFAATKNTLSYGSLLCGT